MSNPDAPKGPKGPTGTRQEIGNSATSHRHPPHITENAEGAPLQEQHPRPGAIPASPPLAQGTDKVPADEHKQPIDPESMYDRRPAEDKDVHPAEADG